MKMMTALEKLPLNAFLLRKNPRIILTLRKVQMCIYSAIILDCTAFSSYDSQKLA